MPPPSRNVALLLWNAVWASMAVAPSCITNPPPPRAVHCWKEPPVIVRPPDVTNMQPPASALLLATTVSMRVAVLPWRMNMAPPKLAWQLCTIDEVADTEPPPVTNKKPPRATDPHSTSVGDMVSSQ